MPGLFENPAAAWFVDSIVILLNTGPEQTDPLPYLIIRAKSSYTEPEQTSASSFTGPKQAATRFANLNFKWFSHSDLHKTAKAYLSPKLIVNSNVILCYTTTNYRHCSYQTSTINLVQPINPLKMIFWRWSYLLPDLKVSEIWILCYT